MKWRSRRARQLSGVSCPHMITKFSTSKSCSPPRPLPYAFRPFAARKMQPFPLSPSPEFLFIYSCPIIVSHIHNYDLVPLITHLLPTVAIHTYLLHLQSLVALRTCLPRTSIEFHITFSDIIISPSDRAPVEMLQKHIRKYAGTVSTAPTHIHISTCMHFNMPFCDPGAPFAGGGTAGPRQICAHKYAWCPPHSRAAQTDRAWAARECMHGPPACSGAGPSILPSGALGTSRRAWR